jgi:peptide/nickel transport system ATP-binding protein
MITQPPPPSSPQAPSDQNLVLRVKDLKTYFFTYDGIVRALDGVTFSVRRGETIGLVGETGCGKSVTAFSITRLIPDPPGRVVSGEVWFNGANLLWALEKEAEYTPIKKTVRIKVKRRYGRIKDAQNRLSAVRGRDISMIFQEPTSAMNPVFSIWNQVGEALEIHRIIPIVDSLLKARLPDPATEKTMIRNLIQAAQEPGQPRLREVAKGIASTVGLPSLESQFFHLLRGPMLNVDKATADITKIFKQRRITGLQRRFLAYRRHIGMVDMATKDLFLREMREGKSYSQARRANGLRGTSARLRNIWMSTPGVKHSAARPLQEELFWQVVMTLESVGIANPVQVAQGYPHELSGGMLQRVMISMALAPEPALLIADEPTTALDVTIQAQILDLMKDLKYRVGTAIILITHDLAVVAETCDRICIMYAGVIVEAGGIKEIFTKPMHPYSQGLLASIPRLDDPDKKLESIPGSVPNLIGPPPGCRFHPRCPSAMEKCKSLRPPMTLQEPSHVVACWLYSGDEVSDY